MELYSPRGFVIWNIVKLTLMPLDLNNEEADSRMFVHVSNAMELYSPLGVVIRNIVKLTLMPGDLTMKKQI